jgi:hypothetical protein
MEETMITIQNTKAILRGSTKILPLTPRTLFRNGEEGAIINASRAETVFADTAGTTPATYGGSVARVNDIGPNGRNAVQSSSSLRPLLGRAPLAGRRNLLTRTDKLVGNGVFGGATIVADTQPDSDGNMTVSTYTQVNAGGSMRLTASGIVAGQSYRFSADLRRISGSNSLTLDVGDGASQTFSISDSLERVERTVVAGSAGGFLDFRSGEGACEWAVANIQLEVGTVATPYQRVGASGLDVTEAGLAAPGYLRFDLTDDRLVHTFPSGFDGDLLIFGRSGSWVQEGVTVAAGGTLTIGPDTVPGAPGGSLLAALGDIVGWLPVGRGTTQAERAKMRDFYMARGAKGFLVPGPEQVTNGTFDTDISGWSDRSTGTASIAWDDGTLKTSSTNSSNRGGARQDIPALITGRFYLVSAEVVSTPSTVLIGGGVNNSTNNVFAIFPSTPGIVHRIFLKPTGTFGIALVGAEPGNTQFDNVSLRELRPEEDW